MHRKPPRAMSGKPGQRGGGWSEPCLKQSWTVGQGREHRHFSLQRSPKRTLKSQSEICRDFESFEWKTHPDKGRAVTLKKHFEVMSRIPHSIYFYTAETASVMSEEQGHYAQECDFCIHSTIIFTCCDRIYATLSSCIRSGHLKLLFQHSVSGYGG